MKNKALKYAMSIAISVSTGILSAFLTMGNMNIYERIIKPPLSPPSFLFPVVWSVLYVLMGISAAIIFENKSVSPDSARMGLRFYSASLILNFLWSIIFFNFSAYLFAFIWILLLWASILTTIIYYRRISPVAAYLQLPYLLWVSFAGYLNLAIFILNR